MIIVAPSHTRAQSAHYTYTRAPSYNIIVIGRRVRCGPEREAPEQALITTTACYDNNNNNNYNDNNIACTYGYCSVYDRLTVRCAEDLCVRERCYYQHVFGTRRCRRENIPYRRR